MPSSTPPATRSVRKSAAERAAEIRDAACAIARADGLVGITLRSVGTRVGVVPALVAHYEPSTDVLVAETFRAIASAELDEVTAVAHRERTAVGRLRALLATTLDPARDPVTAVWVDAWSLGRRNEPLASAVHELGGRWESVVAGILEQGATAGEFTVADRDGLAWLVVAIVDGLNAQSAVHDRHDAAKARLVQRAVARELGLPPDALA